jgi:sortase A
MVRNVLLKVWRPLALLMHRSGYVTGVSLAISCRAMASPTWLERVLIALGCGCLAVLGVREVQAAAAQQRAADTLQAELARPFASDTTTNVPAPVAAVPSGDGIVGRLEIPRLDFAVMVLEGDDTATLARGVGHIPGTALPWEAGNTVMAGHRDTFFRPLEQLRRGDAIRLTTAKGTFSYRVTSTQVVAPSDVSVLAPTPGPSLTLVTCYPFEYVGFAPQRFIIHAE